jgi:hypothetical protein
MFFSRLFLISLLFFNTLYFISKDKTQFISPVKIPLSLSSNFGELRLDHFHSGIDIRTQGVTGKEVVSAADGYVYRIGVSPGGFGNALYVRHPSGYSTVYGHLERFTPEIEEYVKSMQYEKKSFPVTLFLTKEMFPVKQGDLIAYSGNSGSSGGPHLHYEIRKADSELPVNPLYFDFGTSDDINPVFEKLVIYPINRNSEVNSKNIPLKLNVAGGHGNYYIPDDTKINISGLAAFGIKAYDLLNDSYNKVAVYSIELKIDSISLFKYIMDDFSFAESRYINSHIDYETYIREGIYIERTFKLPNDRLTAYKDVVNRGIFNFRDTNIHKVEIKVSDIHNNVSVLSFKVTSVKPETINRLKEKEKDQSGIIMPYNKLNSFSAENIKLTIPSGALYDTLNFIYSTSKGSKNMYSDIHLIHNRYTPVHKPFTIAIKPDTIPSGMALKMTIAQIGGDQKSIALSSTWADGYIKAEASAFGAFYIGFDTIAPVISANGMVSDSDLSGKREMRIRITDDFSGIKSYEGIIDGEWALFEYDQKNSVIIYKFDEKRIKKNTNHSLSLRVADNKDNISHFSGSFTW